MDVVKVFLEDPAALGGGSPPGAGNGHAPPPGGSAEAFLAALRAPATPFARAYLAGTRLGPAGEPLRVGLTALAPGAFVEPLMAWADGRTVTRLTAGGRAAAVLDREARDALAGPAGTLLLALADGPVPADILATVALGDAALSADALRTLLLADAAVAVLRPEPAHDGFDWALTARSPLRQSLADAFRACPAAPGVRRFVLPRVRSEARFYVEQWALDALPAGTEEV